jgi:hypothetical protein
MKKSSQNSKKSKTTGSSAISAMIKHSKDQVIGAVRQRYTGKDAMRNIATDIHRLGSLMNTENKCVYTLATPQACSLAAPLIYGIGTTAQGTASNQREGNSIKIDRIDLNLSFNYNPGTVSTGTLLNQVYNWYLLRYLKTPLVNGTVAFAIGEFLNVDGNGNTSPLSFPNKDSDENFQLLSAGTLDIVVMQNTIPSTISRMVSQTLPVSFHQDYSGAAATTITDSMIFMVFTALNAANAASTSTVTVSTAIWYVDN